MIPNFIVQMLNLKACMHCFINNSLFLIITYRWNHNKCVTVVIIANVSRDHAILCQAAAKKKDAAPLRTAVVIKPLALTLSNVRAVQIAVMIASVRPSLVRERSAALIMAAAKRLLPLKSVQSQAANLLASAAHLVSKVVAIAASKTIAACHNWLEITGMMWIVDKINVEDGIFSECNCNLMVDIALKYQADKKLSKRVNERDS